jgi:hypothetical protein
MTDAIETTVGQFEPERVDYKAWPELVRRAFNAAVSKNGCPGEEFFADSKRDGDSVLLVINGRQFSFEYVIRRFDAQLDVEIDKVARGLVDERAERINKVLCLELDELFPLAKRDEDGH